GMNCRSHSACVTAWAVGTRRIEANRHPKVRLAWSHSRCANIVHHSSSGVSARFSYTSADKSRAELSAIDVLDKVGRGAEAPAYNCSRSTRTSTDAMTNPSSPSESERLIEELRAAIAARDEF